MITHMKNKKFWRDFGEGPRLLELLENNVGKPLIIFDTETTGLKPTEDRIIQISAIKCQIEEDYELSELGRLDIYINPGYSLPKKIVEITGITDALLADKPKEEEVWPQIYDFFGDNTLLCGHNAASFDINMLNAMYSRNTGDVIHAEVYDTLTMARELHHKDEAGGHKLGQLAEYFGLDYGLTFHNSMDDVIATLRLLRYFIEEYREKKEEYEKNGHPPLIKTKIKKCWHYEFMSRVPGKTKADGTPEYRKNLRLYVSVEHENSMLYISQRRPYDWGEKTKGCLDRLDIKDLEKQVLALYGCKTLEELSKVRDTKFARY